MKVLVKNKFDKNEVLTLVVFAAKLSKASKEKSSDTKAPFSFHCENSQAKTLIQTAAKENGFNGDAGKTMYFRHANVEPFTHLLVVGLGKESEIDNEAFRKAAANAYKSLESHKSTYAVVAAESFARYTKNHEDAAQALTEGALLAAYKFTELKSKKSEENDVQYFVLSTNNSTQEKMFQKGVDTGAIIAECMNFSRRLGDTPGNLMTPTILANETVKAAKGTSLKVSVWDKTRIQKEKMGCFWGVAKGSGEEPRFIMMEYKGGAASKKPICLVGKGLTFDAGGISIKPSAGMEEMKFDMCGGANTIGTMLAVAKLKLKVNVIAFVPATENLVGPFANKPGDVITARNGKTVEVNNTDAEGRLILADALCYASEQKPAVILDMATLTGAMVMALGNVHTGYFCRDSKLAAKIHEAAKASGELLWQMPLTDEHSGDMKGTYADLSNMGSTKGAGSAQGAAFMENFVGKDIPWAHFDIAGTGWDTGARVSYNPRKGASGVMIRTWLEFIKEFKN